MNSPHEIMLKAFNFFPLDSRNIVSKRHDQARIMSTVAQCCDEDANCKSGERRKIIEIYKQNLQPMPIGNDGVRY